MPPISDISRRQESIEIDNFAGINKLKLDLRPFTVVIGPQSVGKSITAKLLYFFKGIPWELSRAASSRESPPFKERLLTQIARLLPDPASTTSPSNASFQIGDVSVRLQKGTGKASEWKIEIPAFLREAFSEFREAVEQARGDSDPEDENNLGRVWELEQLAQETYWAKVSNFWPKAASPPRFIPAGRSFYSQIERDMASYFESASLDPFVSEFGKLLARLKSRRIGILRRSLNRPLAGIALKQVDKILSGRYIREGGEDIIEVADGRKLPAKMWSSGQQEAQPLAFILQKCSEGSFNPRILFIEEPEAHLFPTSQKAITELITIAFNSASEDLSLFITTHSPYILTSLNNLIAAGSKYEHISRESGKELEKIVPKELALPPHLVQAYFMDGKKCHSIIDSETGLIDAGAIDAVSGDIAAQFDKILEID